MAVEPSFRLLRDPGHFIALGGGLGLAPWAPGTAGTVAGVGLYLVCAELEPLPYLALTGLMFCLGVPICDRTAKVLGEHDHPAIVWDECVGYMATMAAASGGVLDVVAGFCVFRFFDIVKPWPVRQFDTRVPGGLGIMLDDLLAAVYAGFFLELFKYLSYAYS
jgi:phosphatidylglycerophosphatase A